MYACIDIFSVIPNKTMFLGNVSMLFELIVLAYATGYYFASNIEHFMDDNITFVPICFQIRANNSIRNTYVLDTVFYDVRSDIALNDLH